MSDYRKKGKADAVDKYAGKMLRILRTENKVSQTQAGEHVNVTFQQIQKYERGTNRLSPSKLFAFSKLFNVPVTEFFPND